MAVRQVGNRPRPLLRLLALSLPFRGNSSNRNHSEPRERSKPYTTTTSTRRTCNCMQFACGSGKASMRHFFLTSHSSATRHQWLNLFSTRHECFTSDVGLTRTRLVSCILLTSLESGNENVTGGSRLVSCVRTQSTRSLCARPTAQLQQLSTRNSLQCYMLLSWPRKQPRKPNKGACMLERSSSCATCA